MSTLVRQGADPMQERLQKVLSQWGVASRRQAETLIREGRVQVNGERADLGQRVDPAVDAIAVDGTPLSETRPQHHYVLVNKPRGVVSTCDDPQGRSTVIDLLPTDLQPLGLHPVGRLDTDSTGALLLTNDGELTYQLTHPRHDVPKTYEVLVKGKPSPAVLATWRRGVWLDGRQTRSAEVALLRSFGQHSTLLKVVLWEGRNRQIRRVAEQLGHPVLRLHRVAIGSLTLGSLPKGQFRVLTDRELQTLMGAATAALNT